MTATDDGSDEPSSTRRQTNVTRTSRREYLRLAGVAAVGAAGSAATTTGAAAAEASGIQFEETVNMVEDAGCDPTGEESCHGAIMEYAADGVLLEFPNGRYLLDEPVSLDGYGRLGFRGTGDDVTFVFSSGADGYGDVSITDVGTFLYRNIDWDITAENCAAGFDLRARNRFHLEALEVIGRGDNSGGFALRPGIADPDGFGLVKEFVATQGSKFESAPRGGVLVAAGRNEGTLRFVDCRLEEFENNGLYAAASAGPIQVEGGVFRNNMRSQLRFSGEGSYIEDALVEVDLSTVPAEAEPEGFLNGRGIWWESKNTDPLRTGGEIRDTEVIIRNGNESTVPNTTGGIVVRPDGGACTIRNTRVQMDVTPRVAVYAKAPVGNPEANHPAPPEPHRIVMQDVTITGEASDWAAVQIEERPNSVIDDCDFDVGYRDGIVLAECDGSIVRDTTIDSKFGGGRPLVLWGTEATVSDVTTNNANRIPDGSEDEEDNDGGEEGEDEDNEDEEDEQEDDEESEENESEEDEEDGDDEEEDDD